MSDDSDLDPGADEADTGQKTDGGSEDENGALFKRLKREYRLDRDHLSPWRTDAKEDYGFVSGQDQWSKTDRDYLTDNNRPVITFNRVDPLIRSVSGEQINNAQEVRYIPRELGDAQANEDLTSAAEWFRDECDAGDEESDMFWDAAVCGIGCTDTRLDLDGDPSEPMPVVERIDPMEMLWDRDARKSNLADRRRDWRVRDIPIADARAMFPDVPDADLDAAWARLDQKSDEVRDQTEDDQYLDSGNNSDAADRDDDSMVTMVHGQWFDREPFWKVALPDYVAAQLDGKDVIDLTVAEYKRLRPKLDALAAEPPPPPPPQMGPDGMPMPDGAMMPQAIPPQPIKAVRLQQKVFKQAFIGRKILKTGPLPCPDHFTRNFVTGFRDRNAGTFYGLVRAMKDPQRWANKWMSQTLHIMNTTAKGGVIANKEIAEDIKQFEESWSKQDAITWADRPLSEDMLQPKPGNVLPAGFWQIMEFAISSVRDVAGINLEMLGMREADQPASLEYQRRQAGITILAQLFRSMTRYHRNQGKVLLYYIQNSLSPQTLVKILGTNGDPQYVPLEHVLGMKKADAKFDIIVDEGPTSPNQKERVWTMIGPKYFEMPPPMMLALADYLPLPSSTVAKFKEALNAATSGPQADLQQKMAQLEAMLTEAKVMLTRAQAQEAQATAAKTASEIGATPGTPDAGLAAAEAQAEYAHKNAELQTNASLEAHRINTDAATAQAKIAADAGAKHAAIGAGFQTDHDKIAADRANNLDWMASDAATKARSDAIGATTKIATAEVAAKAQRDKPTPKPDSRPGGV